MHRNHPSEAHTHHASPKPPKPLGTVQIIQNPTQNFQSITPGRQAIPCSRLPSSQQRAPHHHTSEHSEYPAINGSWLFTTPRVRQPIAKHPDQCSRTSTRIQTHQNLFTLTKNNSFLNNQAGNKHPTPRSTQPSQECANRNIETRISP